MIRPHVQITVGNFSFDFVTELEVITSWSSVTDSGFIKLPRRLLVRGETLTAGSSGLFKRGDQVTIKAGYFPALADIFMGYVSEVVPGAPFELKIEDAAQLFKETNITESYERATLKDILQDHCPIDFQAEDIEVGPFRITRANFAQVLAELQKSYGISSWIRSGKLYSGLPYRTELQKEHFLNVQNDFVSEDLIYQNEDEVKVKVKAISIQPDNSRIEVEAGDSDGEQRTLTFYDLTKAELQKTVERELPKLKFSGLKGSFVTFGEPAINHGDIVTISDIKTPERDGSYLVDEVAISLGSSGYRQNIKLGGKL